MLLLGNDIVSLNQSGMQNESRHTRFVNRVFTPVEQSAIVNSNNPDATLWTMWAAKEAAFKVISKVNPPSVFSHKKFEVSLGTSDNPDAVFVRFFENKFSGYVEISEDFVHVVLGSEDFAGKDVVTHIHLISEAEKKQWLDQHIWPEYFSKGELASIKHFESAFIRFLGKSIIAECIKCDFSQLEIMRPTIDSKSQPPFLLIEGDRRPIDISFSHHRSWLAIVISFQAYHASSQLE